MSLYKKTFLAQFVIALFLSNHSVEAAYVSGMSPGMIVRLEQKTLDSMKTTMEKFLP
jgi:hypothetical protein